MLPMQVLKESADCKELCRLADEEMASITGEVMAVDLSYKATLGTRTAEGDRAAAATMTCMNEHVQIMSMAHLPDSKAASQEAVVASIHRRVVQLTGKVSYLPASCSNSSRFGIFSVSCKPCHTTDVNVYMTAWTLQSC